MTEKELMLSGKLHYFMDEELDQEAAKTKEVLNKFNHSPELGDGERMELLKSIFGKIGDYSFISAPFYCDYGSNIEIGGGFFANYDCIILDMCKVTIGNKVMFGPRVCVYAASHPIYAPVRTAGFDIGKPVTIGDNVWIGGNSVINPGVEIGDNTVIGSGSVVTKSIPKDVIAAGNPCRVIRSITEEDKKYWEQQKAEYEQLRKTCMNAK